jgi:hypothetical protein
MLQIYLVKGNPKKKLGEALAPAHYNYMGWARYP